MTVTLRTPIIIEKEKKKEKERGTSTEKQKAFARQMSKAVVFFFFFVVVVVVHPWGLFSAARTFRHPLHIIYIYIYPCSSSWIVTELSDRAAFDFECTSKSGFYPPPSCPPPPPKKKKGKRKAAWTSGCFLFFLFLRICNPPFLLSPSSISIGVSLLPHLETLFFFFFTLSQHEAVARVSHLFSSLFYFTLIFVRVCSPTFASPYDWHLGRKRGRGIHTNTQEHVDTT